jgi:hypothetical protein
MAIVSANGAAAPLSPNYIINGAFEIWQRGTSFTTGIGLGNSFTADRMHCYRDSNVGNATTSRVSSNLPGFEYAIKLQRNSGTTETNALNLRYTLENKDSAPLIGKTVTFSFYAKAGANASSSSYRSVIATGVGVDQPVYSFTSYTGVSDVTYTLTSFWQRFSQTFFVPQSATQIGIENKWTPTGTAGADDSVQITGLQLEASSVATPFRRNSPSIQAELAACQRYFQFVPPVLVWGRTGSSVMFNWCPPVTMRTAPVSSLTTGAPYWESAVFQTIGSLTNATIDSGHVYDGKGGDVLISGTFSPAANTNVISKLGGDVIRMSAEL